MPGRSIRATRVAVLQGEISGEVFDGDPGKIRHLAVEAGELIEKRGLAAIGRPDEGDRAGRFLLNSFQEIAAERRAAALARRHQACSRERDSHQDAPCGRAPDGDFGSIKPVNSGIAAGTALAGDDLDTAHEPE